MTPRLGDAPAPDTLDPAERISADLAAFPMTTKADLRDNYPFGMFAVRHDQVRRIHASSGTTGRPTVVGYTARDIDTWSAVMARSIRAAGGRPGQKVHVAYGYGLFTGALGAHYGAEALGCTVIPVSGGMTARQVQLIQDFRPEIVPPKLTTTSTPTRRRAMSSSFTSAANFRRPLFSSAIGCSPRWMVLRPQHGAPLNDDDDISSGSLPSSRDQRRSCRPLEIDSTEAGLRPLVDRIGATG